MTSRFSACVLALLHFCRSSDSYEPPTLPDAGDPEFIEECVQTHNRFRSGVNPPASNMLYMDNLHRSLGWAIAIVLILLSFLLLLFLTVLHGHHQKRR